MMMMMMIIIIIIIIINTTGLHCKETNGLKSVLTITTKIKKHVFGHN